MNDVAAMPRAGLWLPRSRLPLAGTQSPVQECKWRPSAAEPSVVNGGVLIDRRGWRSSSAPDHAASDSASPNACALNRAASAGSSLPNRVTGDASPDAFASNSAVAAGETAAGHPPGEPSPNACASARWRAAADASRFEDRARALQESWRQRLPNLRRDSAADLFIRALPSLPVLITSTAAELIGRAFEAASNGLAVDSPFQFHDFAPNFEGPVRVAALEDGFVATRWDGGRWGQRGPECLRRLRPSFRCRRHAEGAPFRGDTGTGGAATAPAVAGSPPARAPGVAKPSLQGRGVHIGGGVFTRSAACRCER